MAMGIGEWTRVTNIKKLQHTGDLNTEWILVKEQREMQRYD